MPTNDPVYQKAYKDRHYAENKQKYVEQATKRKIILRDEIRALKEKPCMDCGIEYPYYVMDFDHREGETKEGLIAHMLRDGRRNAVYKEIKKCDLVCSNCHRERTHQREIAGMV